MKTKPRDQTFFSEQKSIQVFEKKFKREKTLYIAPGNVMVSTKREANKTILLTSSTTWRMVREEAKLEMTAAC